MVPVQMKKPVRDMAALLLWSQIQNTCRVLPSICTTREHHAKREPKKNMQTMQTLHAVQRHFLNSHVLQNGLTFACPAPHQKQKQTRSKKMDKS
jgi:hypothetical protein